MRLKRRDQKKPKHSTKCSSPGAVNQIRDGAEGTIIWATVPVGKGTGNVVLCPRQSGVTQDTAFIVDLGACVDIQGWRHSQESMT